MAMEFRPVHCSIDPEMGLLWVDDHLSYPRLVAEVRTISALQRKIARLLDTNVKPGLALCPIRKRERRLFKCEKMNIRCACELCICAINKSLANNAKKSDFP